MTSFTVIVINIDCIAASNSNSFSGRRDEAGPVAEARVRALLQEEERAEEDQAQTLPVLRLPGTKSSIQHLKPEWKKLRVLDKEPCETDKTFLQMRVC